MSKKFGELLEKIKNLGPQSMDRNDELAKWKNEYSKEFKKLSNVAKLTATIKFLEGHRSLSDKLLSKNNANWRRVFPPVSKNKAFPSTLDAGIVERYFKYYNENATSPSLMKTYDIEKGAITTPSLRGEKRIVREACR